MKTLNFSFLLFSLGLLLCSCSSEPEPYEAFLGSYTAQKFCNDSESFTSQIIAGTTGTEVIWMNAAGEDGSVDDLKAVVNGNSISISRQDIGGLEMSATGTLLENGKLNMTTIVFAGPLQVSCAIEFTAQ